MRINLDGRIRNIALAPSNALAPLYEAVVNSIQSVQQRWGKSDEGEVLVKIIREATPQMSLDTGQSVLDPVSQFIIEDNGVGFDQGNYRSFETSDSVHKRNIGGKGVGRFLWLKAFDKVSIRSTFSGKPNNQLRVFDFQIPDGISNHECGPDTSTLIRTSVTLIGFKPQYQNQCPKTAETIASHIAAHCLEYFLLDSCPKVRVVDDSNNLNISVNDRVSSEIILDRHDEAFQIGSNSFKIMHLRLAQRSQIKHSIHYCAHMRAVTSEDLSKKIVDLSSRVQDNEGREFVYAGYVSGSFLDQHVNPERTRFSMSYGSEPDMFGEIDWTALTSASTALSALYLAPFTAPVAEAKINHIQRYIADEAPMYRHLLKWGTDELLKIPPDLPNDDLEIELCKIDQKVRADIKIKTKNISSKRVAVVDRPAIKAEIDELMEAVTDIGQSGLSRYVAYRKVIIDLLEKGLQINANGKYEDEDLIHSIIHPMRMTSDEIESTDYQNLWIIDERLSYHSFLASDMRFKQIGELNSESLNRPDLLILNNPLAFAEGSGPLSSVVIVEFKKAARNNFNEEENPISQVYGYVNEIRKGTKSDIKGRPLNVNLNTPFYCYIVADLTQTLRLQAANHGFRPTPDGLGYFHFNENYNSYTEIISFEKLLDNAKKRNRILFDRLGLR
ncbi:MAG: hypothetical protein ABIY70_14800 [Capsulimonas sp.]|uniref:hypothetical protein n=1 Tax=Capsulimonas sp. TaxID=2494211 RepID=UPI0032632E75